MEFRNKIYPAFLFPFSIYISTDSAGGRLSLSVGWKNGDERGRKTASFDLSRSAACHLGLHCLPMSQSSFYR